MTDVVSIESTWHSAMQDAAFGSGAENPRSGSFLVRLGGCTFAIITRPVDSCEHCYSFNCKVHEPQMSNLGSIQEHGIKILYSSRRRRIHRPNCIGTQVSGLGLLVWARFRAEDPSSFRSGHTHAQIQGSSSLCRSICVYDCRANISI